LNSSLTHLSTVGVNVCTAVNQHKVKTIAWRRFLTIVRRFLQNKIQKALCRSHTHSSVRPTSRSSVVYLASSAWDFASRRKRPLRLVQSMTLAVQQLVQPRLVVPTISSMFKYKAYAEPLPVPHRQHGFFQVRTSIPAWGHEITCVNVMCLYCPILNKLEFFLADLSRGSRIAPCRRAAIRMDKRTDMTNLEVPFRMRIRQK
jgi:hypothetical protein